MAEDGSVGLQAGVTLASGYAESIKAGFADGVGVNLVLIGEGYPGTLRNT